MMEKYNGDITKRKPLHFFKVMLGDYAQRLRIPPAFVKHISEASKRAILEGPSGSIWHAELRKTIDGTYLMDGWQNFAKDHSLQESDFLLFRYDGNMHFSILIFDKRACEREDTLNIINCEKSSICEVRRKRRKPSKNFEGRRKRGRPSKNFVDVRHLSQKKDYNNDSEKHRWQDQHIPSPKPDELISIPGSNRKCYMSKRQLATAVEKTKAWKAVNSFTSTYPYFVTSMKGCNVCWTFILNIPVSFTRSHLPRTNTKMVLRDPNGEAWIVNVVPTPKKTSVSGGWPAFSRFNNLKEGDFCVFELVGPIEFNVHIFRLDEEIEGCDI